MAIAKPEWRSLNPKSGLAGASAAAPLIKNRNKQVE